MLSITTIALQEAIAAFGRDDMASYAHHAGRAGGVAAAVGAYGLKALSLCDDISDAYENSDSGLMEAILAEATERLDNPDNGARVMDGGAINWPEYGAALNQAVEAKSNGDRLRFALMTGFVSGLLFNNPGPEHPEHGTIRDAVVVAYETGSDESLRYAQGRISAGVRHTDPTPFMPDDRYARYREERLRMMRWAQNFGLRQARAGDERMAVPGSMRINDHVRRQAREPDDAAAYIRRGIARMERDDYDGAIADFDSATELDSDNSEAYSHRGSAKSHVGDTDGAIADFDRAIEINPDDVGSYVSRAISKQNKDDHQGAIDDWDRALELKPDDGGWYVNRGMVKEIIDDNDGAIADYNRAAEVEPEYEVAYIARAYIRRKQGDYESAIQDYDRVIELWPDDAATYSDRGFAKSHTGDYSGAIADYDRALELRPDDVALHIDRGLIKSSAGDHDGAIADFGRARDLAKGGTKG
jgi:tetratricopeptide (TPR) repeat protein